MLSKISHTLHRFANGWLVALFFLLDAVFMFFIMPMGQALMKGGSGGPGPIDLLFFYTPAKAYEMVAAYGDAGRSFYRNIELTADLIYPVVYTIFFGLLISWLFQRGFAPGSRMQKWNALPVGGWFFDLLENLGIVGMLSVYPSTPALLGWLTAGATVLKWLLAAGSFVLLLVGLVMAARNRFRKQS